MLAPYLHGYLAQEAIVNFKKSLLSRFRAQKQAKPPESAVCQRLMEECAYLERLQLYRSDLEDSTFGRIIEERIIWRELLDLELQNVDEQIERICETVPDERQRVGCELSCFGCY